MKFPFILLLVLTGVTIFLLMRQPAIKVVSVPSSMVPMAPPMSIPMTPPMNIPMAPPTAPAPRSFSNPTVIQREVNRTEDELKRRILQRRAYLEQEESDNTLMILPREESVVNLTRDQKIQKLKRELGGFQGQGQAVVIPSLLSQYVNAPKVKGEDEPQDWEQFVYFPEFL